MFLRHELAQKNPNFLFDEILERVAAGPVKFKLAVLRAEEGDEVNHATIHWPAEPEVLAIGALRITGPVPDTLAQQKHVIFDPIPRVDGIQPVDAPCSSCAQPSPPQRTPPQSCLSFAYRAAGNPVP